MKKNALILYFYPLLLVLLLLLNISPISPLSHSSPAPENRSNIHLKEQSNKPLSIQWSDQSNDQSDTHTKNQPGAYLNTHAVALNATHHRQEPTPQALTRQSSPTRLVVGSPIPTIEHLIKLISHVPKKISPYPLIISKSLLKPGDDPHFFNLTPQTLKILYQSDLYFTLGLELETPFLKKLKTTHLQIRIIPLKTIFAHNNPNNAISTPSTPKTLDTTQRNRNSPHNNDLHTDNQVNSHHPSAELPSFQSPQSTTPSHHREDHSQDVHFWLSPLHYQALAASIAATLSEYYPQYTEYYQKNLALLRHRTEMLDKRFKTALEQNAVTLYTLHPMLSYLHTQYAAHGLTIVPLLTRNHQASTPRELKTFLTRLKSHSSPPLIIIGPQETTTLAFIQSQYQAATSRSLPVLQIIPTHAQILDEITKIIIALES